MLDNFHSLDLSAKDIDLIEAALHTQKKILAVQSKAGGAGARRKLADLKLLIKRVENASARKQKAEPQRLSHFVRSLFCTQSRCDQMR